MTKQYNLMTVLKIDGFTVTTRHNMRNYSLPTAKRLADRLPGVYVIERGKLSPVYVPGVSA